jgi:hypothetical protein
MTCRLALLEYLYAMFLIKIMDFGPGWGKKREPHGVLHAIKHVLMCFENLQGDEQLIIPGGKGAKVILFIFFLKRNMIV